MTLGVLFGRRCDRETQRFEAENLEFEAALRAREDLAPIDVEFGDRDLVRAAGAWRHQLNSIFTTRVVFVPPHSTREENEATQIVRSIPASVVPAISKLRGW